MGTEEAATNNELLWFSTRQEQSIHTMEQKHLFYQTSDGLTSLSVECGRHKQPCCQLSMYVVNLEGAR